MKVYLETSAAAKMLIDERESAALQRFRERERPQLVANLLLHTELHRIAKREDIPGDDADAVLAVPDMYELSAQTFIHAGLLPGKHLRSLDALHVASALRLLADAILTYDDRVIEAARGVGLAVVAPSDG